jgi:hypothetical protein
MDFFPNAAVAYRRLAKLRKRGKLNHVGTVMFKDYGRPQDVYCGWKPKDLKHEVLLTEFMLLYEEQAVDVKRGFKVDKRFRADAEMTLSGAKFYVEMDTGTMRGYGRVEERWANYAGCDGTLLVVTVSQARLESLLKKSESVAQTAWFTVLELVRADPYGYVWMNSSGEEASLPE